MNWVGDERSKENQGVKEVVEEEEKGPRGFARTGRGREVRWCVLSGVRGNSL